MPSELHRLVRLLVGRIGSVAVDQPWYPETIHHHAKARGPKGLLERHHDPPVLRQLIENALCLRRVLHLEREGKPLWLLVALWCDVASHQYVITDGQTAVHDLVLPVVRDFASQRRATVPED